VIGVRISVDDTMPFGEHAAGGGWREPCGTFVAGYRLLAPGLERLTFGATTRRISSTISAAASHRLRA
jgi:hypothetical protein